MVKLGKVKLPSLGNLRRPRPKPAQREQEPSGAEQQQPLVGRLQRPPTPGQLRRERRALVRAREERVRDLGGLLLEMYKREQFRQDLYLEQCAEIISMEDRIRELGEQLAAATRSSLTEANRCACGAPIMWGAHFCANCGRPVGEQAVVACAHCGAPLPADASFCAGCGRPAEPAESKAGRQADASGREETVEVSPGSQGR